jgi:diacylglycerol kinase (ATP)
MNEKPNKMDINMINDQYFIYTAASGILTRVSYDVSRRHIKKYGYLAYVIRAMQDFAHDYKYPITIKTNDKEITCECVMVLGLSSNRVGGMRLYNFSDSRLNDGFFELRLFTRTKSFWRFRLLSSFLRGGKKLREDLHLVSDHFEIKTNPDVDWNADGEFATKGDITIKVVKEAISIFASKKVVKKAFKSR